MKIEDIEVVNLVYAYPEDGGYLYSAGKCTHRLTSLVRVHTDRNVEGIGSCYTHPEMARTVIEGYLRPWLLGEDPTNVETLWERMYRATRWFGRKGAAVSALGALDMAFWDLKGKAAGKPVSQLLGSEQKAVPAYASGLFWRDDLDDVAKQADAHWARGFRRMKMRLGRGRDYDRGAVEAVQRVLGKRGELMVDGSMSLGFDEAVDLGRFLAARNVFWFEEPFAPEDIDSYAALRAERLGVRIAAGENEFGHQGFSELVRAGAIDIAQPDASRAGGISEVVRVGKMAAPHGVAVAPHTWSDAVTVIANAHAVASLPNALTVEVDQSRTPFIEKMIAEPLKIVDGMLALPEGPGLGIEVAWDEMRPYLLKAGDPVPVGNYSDMIFGGDRVTEASPANV